MSKKVNGFNQQAYIRREAKKQRLMEKGYCLEVDGINFFVDLLEYDKSLDLFFAWLKGQVVMSISPKFYKITFQFEYEASYPHKMIRSYMLKWRG